MLAIDPGSGAQADVPRGSGPVADAAVPMVSVNSPKACLLNLSSSAAAHGLVRRAAELDQLVGQFRYQAGPEKPGSVPIGESPHENGKSGSRKPGNRIPYRRL
jgi:hypothetical protein